MIAAQTFVFLLVLYSVAAIESEVREVAAKIDTASKLSEMGMISENVMLDCCFTLHGWVRGCSEPTSEGIILEAAGWEGRVTEYLDSAGFNCTIALEDIVVESLANQTHDLLQMGFLGEKGDERWHVTATLKVQLFSHLLSNEAIHQICIIA